MELSESDRITARIIIEKGLQTEYKYSLNRMNAILKEWETAPANHRDIFYKLYRKMVKNDKLITQRYDGVTSDQFLSVMAAQLVDGIIGEEDLESLSEEVRKAIEDMISI